MAVRLSLRCECRDSLRLSRYSFCKDDQNCFSLCWPFFRVDRRRVMLSMTLKSRSSTSWPVVTNTAVELVKATKWLVVTFELFWPSTLLAINSFGCELISEGASTATSCIEETESGKSDWESTAWPCNHSWYTVVASRRLKKTYVLNGPEAL